MQHELLKTFADVVTTGKHFMEAAEKLNAIIHAPATEEQLDDLLTVYRAHGSVNGDTPQGALEWWKEVAGVVGALKLAAELARDTFDNQPLGAEMLPASKTGGDSPTTIKHTRRKRSEKRAKL